MRTMTILSLVFAAIFLAGCEKQRDAGVIPPAMPTPEVNKMTEGARLLQYQTKVFQRPPYYKGNMPLKYIQVKRPIGSNNMINVVYDFGAYKNLFGYKDPAMKYSGMAQSAVTVDSSGRVLAIAVMSRLKGNPVLEGLEIDEYHLNPDGSCYFYCRSLMKMGIGHKVSETGQKGKKQKEYYAVWPMSSY